MSKYLGGLTFAWSALFAIAALASGVLTATISELIFCILIGIFSLYVAKSGRI